MNHYSTRSVNESRDWCRKKKFFFPLFHFSRLYMHPEGVAASEWLAVWDVLLLQLEWVHRTCCLLLIHTCRLGEQTNPLGSQVKYVLLLTDNSGHRWFEQLGVFFLMSVQPQLGSGPGSAVAARDCWLATVGLYGSGAFQTPLSKAGDSGDGVVCCFRAN